MSPGRARSAGDPADAPDLAGLWAVAYAGAQDGHDAPHDDRLAVERAGGDGAAAYGELSPGSAASLLRWLRLGPEDVFVDLGAGMGKLVHQAACSTRAGRAVGVELSRFRHEVARAARARLLELVVAAPGGGAAAAATLARRIELRCEDLRATDLADATVVYAGSTVFPPPLLAALAARVAVAPRVRALVSGRALPPPWDARFRERGRVRVDTSWSRSERVLVYDPPAG